MGENEEKMINKDKIGPEVFFVHLLTEVGLSRARGGLSSAAPAGLLGTGGGGMEVSKRGRLGGW
eukprot:6490739-Amphidinium_carterae.3